MGVSMVTVAPTSKDQVPPYSRRVNTETIISPQEQLQNLCESARWHYLYTGVTIGHFMKCKNIIIHYVFIHGMTTVNLIPYVNYFYSFVCKYKFYLVACVVGRLEKHTITDSTPEASSRPFINILKHKECPVVQITYIDPLSSLALYRLPMCDRAQHSIYVGFPPIVCTL